MNGEMYRDRCGVMAAVIHPEMLVHRVWLDGSSHTASCGELQAGVLVGLV